MTTHEPCVVNSFLSGQQMARLTYKQGEDFMVVKPLVTFLWD